MDRSGQARGPGLRSASRLFFVQASYGLVPIGWVRSALRVLDDAPNQRDGAPRAWVRFDEQVAEGAKDLRPGDEDRGAHLAPPVAPRRAEHASRGRHEPAADRRVQHLFAQSAEPHRPAPCRIVARDGLRIEVDALEAIDGTPVVDVKPAIDPPA